MANFRDHTRRGQSRFKKRNSDRSGFTFLERELIRDNGSLVGPEEFDSPPPSNEPLGGEGDISPGDVRANDQSTETPDDKKIPIQYVTAGGGVTATRKVYNSSQEVLSSNFIHIVGSNQTVDITANPQISAGSEGDKLTLLCVGSNVILNDGNGLSLRKTFNMDSGAIINLYYTSANTVWHELSRGHQHRSFV